MSQNIDTCRRYDSNQRNLRVARYFENSPGSDIPLKMFQGNSCKKSFREMREDSYSDESLGDFLDANEYEFTQYGSKWDGE